MFWYYRYRYQCFMNSRNSKDSNPNSIESVACETNLTYILVPFYKKFIEWFRNSYKMKKHIITETITNKFENHLLSIKAERQKMIHPNSHPTYNERHHKIIGLIDWTLEKYRDNIENAQLKEEQIIIDDIIKQLDKKRDIAIHKMKKAQLRDEVSMYRLQETTLDYVLFRIRELKTGKLY